MQRTHTICLIILATIATGFSLAYLKTVLLPFVIAAFIVIGCRPVLEFAERKLRLHRFLAFLVTFSIGGCLFAAFALLSWVSIADLAVNSAAYEQRLNKIAIWVVDHVPDAFNVDANASERQGERSDSAIASSGEDSGEAFSKTVGVARDPSAALQRLFSESSWLVKRSIIDVASTLPNLFSYAALVLIFVFFLLLEKCSARPILSKSNETLSIEQRVMGKSFDVRPIVLLLGMIFFGLIWGIVGMFLETLIVSTLKTVLQQSQSGKSIAELMTTRFDPARSVR
ncbi:hypothetical protein [Novipirellula sp.]|uniref:AI-2E family transporter n=1 Tax=Novipirellula sp. TaxID=2795430 RepID=UPI00356740A3